MNGLNDILLIDMDERFDGRRDLDGNFLDERNKRSLSTGIVDGIERALFID
jgi:hypothetical protein